MFSDRPLQKIIKKYPKTAVLLISTHGIIKLEYNPTGNYTKDDIPTYTIPKGITVLKATAVPPGMCNYVYTDTTTLLVDFIHKNMTNELEAVDNDDDELLRRMKKILDIVYRPLQEEIAEQLRKEIAQQKKDNEDYDNESEDFYRSFRRGGIVSKYVEGDCVLDKTYLRDNPDMHEMYDWQIIGLNMDGLPDLVPYIQGRKSHYGTSSYIDLSEIIRFLKERGTERIIIFDIACSTYRAIQTNNETGEIIMDNETHLPDLVDSNINPRNIRHIRSELISIS